MNRKEYTDGVRALEAQVESLNQEVERLRAENRRWARVAGTDALTGLPNKISILRAFVPQALHKAQKKRESVGLVLISADNLGEINESFGREAGDEVIKGLGALIQSLVRDEGRLGILDGSNFVLMIYPALLEDARSRANMIRARTRIHAFPCGDTTAQITVSAGVIAILPKEEDDLQQASKDLFRQVNEALFAAKKAGGNRVEVAADEPDVGAEG